MSIDVEKAKSSDEPGTLASMREKLRQERVFTGHPAEFTELGGEEEEPQGKHVKPPEDETPPEKPEPPESKPEPPEEPRFKYKSQEEAERAQREAERKMHEATTKLSEVEKKLEELQSAPPASPAPTPEEVEEEVANTLEEIDNLDPYADDYAKQRAKLWARVATLRNPGATIDQSLVAQEVDRVLEEKHRAEKEERSRQSQEEASRQAAVRLAAEAGLKMDNPVVERLFWDALNRAPYHEGVTLKEQVDYMVSEVQEVYSNLASEKGAASPEPSILERGSRTPVREPASEETPRRTMGDIKEKLRQTRTI